MLKNYNLFGKLEKDIESFDNGTITIARTEEQGNARYLRRNTGGYVYSQKKLLNVIDLYDNSKFETGITDTEGMRKVFLNIGTFRRQVASKMIRLGVKDYVFIPDNYESIWKTWFASRQFKTWARNNGQAEFINELEETFPKYGTIVVKKIGKRIERVNLRNLRNTQDAKTLKQAVLSNGYVIEEHHLSKYEMQDFPDWNLDSIEDDKYFDENGKATVYEYYKLIPRYVIDRFEGKQSDDETLVLSVSFLCPSKSGGKVSTTGSIIYVQELKEKDWPYEEEHWQKQDGRWMGVGEWENLLENQIARNVSANLRRRSLLWASKKVFQSKDEAVQRNLIRDVRDGNVLHVGMNGEISQINMGTNSMPEFNADDKMWEDNSNQRSFTFEVTTGQSLPSGTPFQLGVLLSNAAATHFDQMKEKFGLFLIRSYYNQLVPIFKKESAEELIQVAGGEEACEHLFEALKEHLVWTEFKRLLLGGVVSDPQQLYTEADTHIKKQAFHFFEAYKGFYDDAKFHMELELTSQAQDTKADLETLKSIWMTAARNPAVLQDPNLVRLLEVIVSKTGGTFKDFMGSLKTAPTPVLPPNGGTNTQGAGALPAAQ